MSEIPWDKLGIPAALREQVQPEAPAAQRMAVARGQVACTPEQQLAMLYVCLATGDRALGDTAVATLRGMTGIPAVLGNRTHSKVLEFIAEFHPDPANDAAVLKAINCNDRTACIIAARADAMLAEQLCDNHERLLMTPDVLVALHGNLKCGAVPLERAIAFLRMEQSLPELPAERGAAPPPRAAPAAAPPAAPVFDLDAEIEAALAGKPSPALAARQKLAMFDLDRAAAGGPLGGFAFDFKNEDDFGLDLLEDGASDAPPEMRLSIEKRIAAMNPGKKIKLAYLGNKESRNILLRDRNKQVALAVVKSGRMTDNEALNAAGNRNMSMDVLREVAANREWMRKYPIKVALVNNPRTPPSVAVPIVSSLQKRELEQLARNRNVSSVLFTMAEKLMRQKAQGDKKEQ